MAVAARGSFSKCVFLLSSAVSKTISRLISADGERERERRGSDRIPFLLFSYIFKYFAGYLDLISDLGDRDALEIHS